MEDHEKSTEYMNKEFEIDKHEYKKNYQTRMGPMPKYIRYLRIIGILYILAMMFLLFGVSSLAPAGERMSASDSTLNIVQLVGMLAFNFAQFFILVLWPWFLYKPIEAMVALHLLSKHAKGNWNVRFKVLENYFEVNYCGPKYRLNRSTCTIQDYPSFYQLSNGPTFMIFIPKRVFSDIDEQKQFVSYFNS